MSYSGPTFAQHFNDNKKKKNLSFQKLSEATGISTSVLFSYSKGFSHPEGTHLTKVCKALGLNPELEAITIKHEKDNKVFTKAKYPDFRETIISLYAIEYSELSDNPISKQQIIEEFEKTPFHPYEDILNKVISKKLKRKEHPEKLTIAAWKNDKNPELEKYELKKIIKSVLTDWGVVSSGKILIMSFLDSKGIKDTERYRMETTIKWSKDS